MTDTLGASLPPRERWVRVRVHADAPTRQVDLDVAGTYRAHRLTLVVGAQAVSFELLRPMPDNAPPHVVRESQKPQQHLGSVTRLEIWTREPPKKEASVPSVEVRGGARDRLDAFDLKKLPGLPSAKESKEGPHAVTLRDLVELAAGGPYETVSLQTKSGDTVLGRVEIEGAAQTFGCKFNRKGQLVCRRASDGAQETLELRGILRIDIVEGKDK